MNTGLYETVTCSTGEQESAGTEKEGQTRSMLWKVFPEAVLNKPLWKLRPVSPCGSHTPEYNMSMVPRKGAATKRLGVSKSFIQVFWLMDL